VVESGHILVLLFKVGPLWGKGGSTAEDFRSEVQRKLCALSRQQSIKGRPSVKLLRVPLSRERKRLRGAFAAIFNFDDSNEKVFSSLLEELQDKPVPYATQQPSSFLSPVPMVRQTF
jgi:hypothetical protein